MALLISDVWVKNNFPLPMKIRLLVKMVAVEVCSVGSSEGILGE